MRGQERTKVLRRGLLYPQGQKEERMLPSLILASKSSNMKCFKCLGKRHIALNYHKKRNMILKEDETMDNDSSRKDLSSNNNLVASCEYLPNKEGDLLMVRRLMITQVSYVQSSLMVAAVSLAFVLGKYEEEILCGVVPMEATHVNLGRPWQYNHNVTYDGVTNRFTFVHRGQKVILKPLLPKEVNED
ncbi:hypothetical protein CR513_46857, partial [Mucuna pruriens]